MDTIGDPLNPVYVNERGNAVKSSLSTNNLKGKVALGTNADGTFKEASLAISTDSPSTTYDDTKIATKGYVDKVLPSVPGAGRLVELDGGKYHVKVDSSLKNADGSVKSADFVGIANGQLVAKTAAAGIPCSGNILLHTRKIRTGSGSTSSSFKIKSPLVERTIYFHKGEYLLTEHAWVLIDAGHVLYPEFSVSSGTTDPYTKKFNDESLESEVSGQDDIYLGANTVCNMLLKLTDLPPMTYVQTQSPSQRSSDTWTNVWGYPDSGKVQNVAFNFTFFLPKDYSCRIFIGKAEEQATTMPSDFSIDYTLLLHRLLLV